MLAAYRGDVAAAALLLARGADVSAQDTNDLTAVYWRPRLFPATAVNAVLPARRERMLLWKCC